MSALAEVRVKRGPRLMSVALFHGLGDPLKEMGWFSAALDPIMKMQSECLMSIQWLVIAPRPNDSARAATVALCQMRAWCSM
jgi:hypothetical protein